MSNATPFERIDHLGQLARNSDPITIRNLVVEIFRTAGVQSDYASSIQDRIVVAELAYRAQRHAAIPERNIVRTLNQLATTLNLPSYAQTSPNQVRQLRIRLHALVPHLGTINVDKQSKTISDQMSPLEAAFLTCMLIIQKRDNPDFQVDPLTWDQQHPIPPEPASVGTAPAVTQPQLRVGPRADQGLRNALHGAASQIPIADLLKLVSDAASDLGY